MPIIEVRNLTKSFPLPSPKWWRPKPTERRYALRNISFQIEPGEIVGYIGANGAGKSTTIKILSGILIPDSGDCVVRDCVPWENRRTHVSQVGAVFGHKTQLWWDLPVRDSFELIKDLYRIERERYRQSLASLVNRLDIAPLLAVPVRQLSLGQRMRCELCAALLHSPSIVFLDEPTIGLDFNAKTAAHALIRSIARERGTTIIVTTHNLEDIEALCDRVIVLSRGTIVADTTLPELRRKLGSERWLTMDVAPGRWTFDALPPSVKLISHDGTRICCSFNSDAVSPSDLIAQFAARFPVRDLLVENPPIEKLIGTIFQDN